MTNVDDTFIKLLQTQEDHEAAQEMIALIICIVFLIVYGISLWILSKTDDYQIHISMKILPILYISVYLFRFALEISCKIEWDKGNIDLTSMLYIWTILDICFIITHSIFYLIMILRLKLSFVDSAYELSRCKYGICVILLILIVIINILYYIVDRARPESDSLLNENSFHQLQRWNAQHIDTSLFTVLVTLNIVLGIILIHQFCTNILSLIRKLGDMDQFKSKQTESKQLNEFQEELLNVAVKYGLLCSIAIIVTNIQFTGWIILSYGAMDKYPEAEIKFDIVQYWLFDMVLIVNFSSIWLSYKRIGYAQKAYNCLCSCCHDCCKSNMEWYLKKGVEGKMNRNTDDTYNNLKKQHVLNDMELVPKTLPTTPENVLPVKSTSDLGNEDNAENEPDVTSWMRRVGSTAL